MVIPMDAKGVPKEPLLWRLLPEVWDPHDRPLASKLQQLWFLFIQCSIDALHLCTGPTVMVIVCRLAIA